MLSRLRGFSLWILHQIPAVLTLGLLGGIAWWGYVWDWKIPSLPELLHPSQTKKEEEAEKKPDNKDDKNPNKPLPPFKLDSEEARISAGVRTETIQPKWVDDYIVANGDIEFDQSRYAHLSTRASGTAKSVHIDLGQKVNKGEVLALVASPDLARLKFDLQQTLLTVQMREKVFRRLQLTGGATSPKDLESAEFALRDARIALSKDVQSLQNLGLSVPLDEFTRSSDEQIAARLHTLGIPEKLLQKLDPEIATGNDLLPMYAPFDGVVIKRDIVPGETVSPQTPQFQLADVSRLWIMLRVRLEDADKVRRDQHALFHLDGPNENAPPAKIQWISAEVDEKTRTVAVRAEVENPEGRLRPHTFGSARIVVNRQQRLTVPNDALQFDGTSHLVFAQGDSPLEFQPLRVQLGPSHEAFTVVLDGLKAGQTLAVSGTRPLLSEMLKERIGGDD